MENLNFLETQEAKKTNWWRVVFKLPLTLFFNILNDFKGLIGKIKDSYSHFGPSLRKSKNSITNALVISLSMTLFIGSILEFDLLENFFLVFLNFYVFGYPYMIAREFYTELSLGKKPGNSDLLDDVSFFFGEFDPKFAGSIAKFLIFSLLISNLGSNLLEKVLLIILIILLSFLISHFLIAMFSSLTFHAMLNVRKDINEKVVLSKIRLLKREDTELLNLEKSNFNNKKEFQENYYTILSEKFKGNPFWGSLFYGFWGFLFLWMFAYYLGIVDSLPVIP